MKNDKLTESYRVNFSKADAERIAALAEREGRSVAAIIRRATLRGLSEKGES